MFETKNLEKKDSSTASKKVFTKSATKIAGVLLLVITIFALGFISGGGRLIFTDLKGLSNQNTELPEDLDYSSVERVYDSLKANYDGELNTEELLNGLKEGLARASGDPYTEFLDSDAAQDFTDDLNGSFSGIGAELAKRNNAVVIIAPLAGFPAEEAGLRPGDVIAEIDGESALDLSVSEAVKKIRGPVGEEVELTIIREGASELKVKIKRAQITVPSVEWEVLAGTNIGYIKISRFGPDTTNLARKAASELKDKKIESVILDLRSNPGGLLNSSVELSSLWLEKGDTVLEERRGGKTIKTFRALGDPMFRGMSTVVLINSGSASASEITAGALADNGKARLVGEKTFGKGSVQQLVDFRDNTVLKVTIARWYTPSGRNIDQEGIEPDQLVEFTEEDFENDRDPQKDKAIEMLKK